MAMSSIATSLHLYKNANINVDHINTFFHSSKKVDITEILYPKQQPQQKKKKQKTPGIYKIIKRVRKIVKVVTKTAKFLKAYKQRGIPGLLQEALKTAFPKFDVSAKFIVKKLRKIIVRITQWLLKGVHKIFKFFTTKLINKNTFKEIIKLVKTIPSKLKTLLPKLKKVFFNIAKSIWKFISKPVIKLLVRVGRAVTSWLKRLKLIKHLLKTFGKVKNFIISKAGAFFSKSGLSVAFKKGVGQFVNKAGTVVGTFKKGTSKVISKVVGFGKDVSKLAVKSAKGTLRLGKEFYSNVKTKGIKWFSNLSSGMMKGKSALKNLSKNTKFVKKLWGFLKAVAKFIAPGIKALMNAVRKAGSMVIRALINTAGTGAAIPTVGISLLLTFILGALWEGAYLGGWGGGHWAKLADAEWYNVVQRTLSYGWDSAQWLFPVGVTILIEIVKIICAMLAPLFPAITDLFSDKEEKYRQWKEAQDTMKKGEDVVFTSSNNVNLKEINDCKNNALTLQMFNLLEKTDKCNDYMKTIITSLGSLITKNYYIKTS